MDKMTQIMVMEQLKTLPEWKQISEVMISRTYEFEDFVQSMIFVNKVADLAEAVQHHPDIIISYSKVILNLSTHDVGGLSEKDFEFAGKADAVAAIQ